MKKFEGILICTDLDGTLLNSEHTVSRENIDAIEHFKAEGGIFTFITGRMPYFAADIYDTVKPNAPFGCINGGGLYDKKTGKYLWSQILDPSVIELVEYVDKNVEGIGIQVNTLEKLYFARNNSAMERFRKITGMENTVLDYKDVDLPIGKIVFGDEDEDHIDRVKTLLDNHPRASEFDFIRSELTLYEILPKGINKGSVLPILAKHMGIDMSRTVAVGDYNNDVGMIKAAGIGIAVANATPEAKAVADVITVSNNDHAIAKIISDIECGILKI